MKYFVIAAAFLVASASSAIVKRDATATDNVVSKLTEQIKTMAEGLTTAEVQKIVEDATVQAKQSLGNATEQINKMINENVTPEVRDQIKNLKESIDKNIKDLSDNIVNDKTLEGFQKSIHEIQEKAKTIATGPEMTDAGNAIFKAVESVTTQLRDLAHTVAHEKEPHSH